MAEWYDDPCFDEMTEVIDGRTFRGDDWRRMMRLKEEARVQVVPVAVVQFRQEALKTAIKEGRFSSPILVPEPTNPHDPNAIRVEINNQHVGYVPRGTQVSPDSRAHICKWSIEPLHVWLAVEC